MGTIRRSIEDLLIIEALVPFQNDQKVGMEFIRLEGVPQHLEHIHVQGPQALRDVCSLILALKHW